MKQSFLRIGFLSLLTLTFMGACKSPGEKLDDANENAREANAELNQANEEYLNDIATYKMQMSEVIETNNKSIADFKSRIAYQKAEAKEEYKAKIEDLEHKNTDIKKRMDDYKAEGKENWNRFKSEFGHDMDALGEAFKDFTVKNNK